MIIIGENINATIPRVRKIIEARDARALETLGQKQARAGASFIDINVGTGRGTRDDEIEAMQWAVEVISKATDISLCIDSADAAVIEAGLEAGNGRASLVNSIKADDRIFETIIPLARRYAASLVALAMDENGIPDFAEGRLTACRRIIEKCDAAGVPRGHVYLDPLVLPVSADARQGVITLETLSAVKTTFPGIHTTLGLSNVSFGMPGRSNLNAAFLYMALYSGLDAAIMDPLDETLMAAVRTGEALLGKDRHFRRYTRSYRKNR
jgi:5-methyltetrahydrofolate--homocysteine methyltransferase